MPTLDTILEYILWPLLLVAALIPTGIGIASGHATLAFACTYFGLAGALYFLERLRPHEPLWTRSDAQELPDFAHTALSKSLVQFIVASLGWLGLTGAITVTERNGFWPGHWPMFFQVTLALVIAEFGLYWAHRVAHEWAPLWHFHAVHHSSKKLWFFNTGRFHVIDTLKSVFVCGLLLTLAGAPKDVVMWFGAITPCIGFLTHCNVRMRFGWLNYIFNTPALHRWHHSTDPREGNKNYGENLVLWDLIFGTYFVDNTRPPPTEIGIKHAMPDSFIGQVVMPFRWHAYQARFHSGDSAQRNLS